MNDGRDNPDSALAGVEQLRREHQEMRALLERAVKYVREDRAETPGSTRLPRLASVVERYLKGAAVPVASEAQAFEVGDTVRVTGDTANAEHEFRSGTEGTITALDCEEDAGLVLVVPPRAESWWVHPRDLVLVRKASTTEETSHE